MKREGYWLLAIVVLVALAAFALYKVPKFQLGLDIKGGVRAVLQAVPGPHQTFDLGTVEQVIENRLNSSGVSATSVEQQPPDELIVEIPYTQDQDQIVQDLQNTAQLEFRWFRDVQYADNGRPVTARYIATSEKDAEGREEIIFTDRQTNFTFEDESHIKQDFQPILKDSSPRPGATAYTVPSPLAQSVGVTQPLYLTPDQQKTVQNLNQQLLEWQTLDSDAVSPIIMTGNEIESNAHAGIDPTEAMPVVDLTCTARGTELWANFTREHNEQADPGGDNLTGIILDGRVLDAPSVHDAILDGNTQISGGFRDVSDAQSLANLLNAGALPVPLRLVESTSVQPTLGSEAVAKMEFAGIVGGAAVLLFMAAYYLLPGLLADVALIIYTLFALAIFKAGIPGFLPPITLTLPGIAAFILSVGMAVDANILIFERLKEELRNGKALRPAVDAGFKRAFTAIRDSNACTLITCGILGWMGTPDVKGFAVTLAIGVVLSLFTAITVTRTFLYLLVDAGVGNSPALFGLRRQWGYSGARMASGETTASRPPVNVIGKRYWFYGLSLLIIIPGIIFWFMGGLKRNIEFTGGTQVEVVFARSVPQLTIERSLVAAGYKDNLVQMAQSGQVAFVTVRQQGTTAYQGVEKALDNVGTPYTLQSHRLVGGTISKQLTQNAVSAVVYASLLIVCYLAIAFAMAGQGNLSLDGELVLNLGVRVLGAVAVLSALVLGLVNGWHVNNWLFWEITAGVAVIVAGLFSIGCLVAGFRFGSSAIAALLHDVLVLIGSFAILGYFLNWQIDSMFIVATLTVVGFSVHDTIVIFDRLRENLRRRLRGESFEELANRSILQSFARSINTSFTVILTLTAMMIWGEPSTRLLITALLIGIVSGTYSSIFNATPILVDWEIWIAKVRGLGGTRPVLASVGPAHEPVARGTSGSTRASGGSAKPIRPADDNAPTPVAQSPEEGDAAESAPGARPVAHNRPKKRSARRY